MTRSSEESSALTVAIDATHLRQGEGGIARYIRGLVTGLRSRADTDVMELGAGPREKRGTLRKKALTAGLDFVWYPWLGRNRAAVGKADVFHCPAPRGPLRRAKLPVVMTIHDLVPFLFPETMTLWSRIYTRATLPLMAAAADRIICPSGSTAKDVVRIFGIGEDRVRIIHLGVDSIFFEPLESLRPPATPYVLFVGTQEQRKNLHRLEKAVERVRSHGYPHELVLAGADAWGDVRLAKPFVKHAGRVTDERLKELYANAACLAIPSLHEGFGLPALEAMAVGTPVVAGRAGSLPEVTADNAVLVDPLDVADIAKGIEQAITGGTSYRENRRQYARGFTWEKTAAATRAVYEEVIQTRFS